ncbi:MAG: SDR family oxidoreductase [Anaerolineales bacterium]|nr:SDR family oxidoreductase [Anaerolineales bacterium]
MNPEHKIALITGGANRVGGHITRALARAGADVVIHYHRSETEARATADEVRAMGVQAYLVGADLNDIQALDRLFQEIEEAAGGLDILINSAAIMESIPFEDVTPGDWERTMNINLRAPFFCIQKAAAMMSRRGAGAIVNISDIAGRQPWPRFPVHSLSKSAVEMLTAVSALTFGPEIRVNAVAPGPVLKPRSMSDERWQALGQDLPLQRTGSAEDVARAVLFLIENDYITGETIAVDGGNQWVS